MKQIFIVIGILFLTFSARGQQKFSVSAIDDQIILVADREFSFAEKLALKIISSERTQENPRLMAMLLTVTLGPFGAHRIYLGTEPKVPIFYTLTLGGGLGILPVIDLLHLIFTKDISVYYNDPRIFMWSGVGD